METPKVYEATSQSDHRISIGGWTIEAVSDASIGGASDYAAAEQRLHCALLPEMMYPHAHVHVTHEASGHGIRFCALDALASCAKESTVQVHVAREWKRGKVADVAAVDLNMDWTFTPIRYTGVSLNNDSTQEEKQKEMKVTEAPVEALDLTLLTRPDPILFYAEVDMYASDLDDHGACWLKTRVRVMPSCWLILCRYFLRVDSVCMRVCDVRLFGRHGESRIYRDYQIRERSLLPPSTSHSHSSSSTSNSSSSSGTSNSSGTSEGGHNPVDVWNTITDPQTVLNDIPLQFHERQYLHFV
jgi:type 2A phosphatase activator TIP41